MSKGATLSIMGLYNNDNTVLDAMVFPDGFTDEQKEIVKQNILIECAELEFLYPKTEYPDRMRGIGIPLSGPYCSKNHYRDMVA